MNTISTAFICILFIGLCEPVYSIENKILGRNLIQNDIKDYGSARVIVEFKSNDNSIPHNDGLPMKENETDHYIMQIKEAQSRIISKTIVGDSSGLISKNYARRNRLYKSARMLGMTVNNEELNRLSENQEVTKVSYDARLSADLQDSVPLIGMPGQFGAYSMGAYGQGEAIAIIDTGVDTSHPFISDKIISGACFSNPGVNELSLCPNGEIFQVGFDSMDINSTACLSDGSNICGHGTHVSGIAAGFSSTNSIPPFGVASKSSIIPIQAFVRPINCNSPSCLVVYKSDVLAALDWIYTNAITNEFTKKISSINMSLGGESVPLPCADDPARSIINKLKSLGISIVASAGNDASYTSIGFPACIPGVISVGSTGSTDSVSSFSNRSPMVRLFAPGESINSSYPKGAFKKLSGTSFSAPHVAGAIAAIRSIYPDLDINQIEGSLRDGGNVVHGTDYGHRIDVAQALRVIPLKWHKVDISTNKGGIVYSSENSIFCIDECTSTYLDKSELKLSAKALDGYEFLGWSGDCIGSGLDCILPVDSKKNINANFESKDYELIVDPPKGGRVISSPKGINCGKKCRATFNRNQIVKVVAIPSYGHRFNGWLQSCGGTKASCIINSHNNSPIHAEFVSLH